MSVEQARYEVRTPMWLWLTNGVLTTFCVLVFAGYFVFDSHMIGFWTLIMGVMLVGLVAFWLSVPAYRVGGGRNLIRFFDDRIEVPGPSQRKPLVFLRQGLVIEIHAGDARLGLFGPITSLAKGTQVVLRNAAQRRRLSTLILAQEVDERPLLADLQRFVDGQPAIGRDGHAVPPPRTNYDDRLDRELAQLD